MWIRAQMWCQLSVTDSSWYSVLQTVPHKHWRSVLNNQSYWIWCKSSQNLFLLRPSRSHLVPDRLHCRRWSAAGWPELGLGGGGRGGGLSHSHLLHLLPPVPLPAIQHHDGGEQGWRPQLELAQKPLGPARSPNFRSWAGFRHPGERLMQRRGVRSRGWAVF